MVEQLFIVDAVKSFPLVALFSTMFIQQYVQGGRR